MMDWVSVKLNAGCIVLAMITANTVLIALTAIATISTIVYNGIKIYKELHGRNDNRLKESKETRP